jgi:cytochrome c oxidase subunit I+III
MPRRIAVYPDGLGWDWLNLWSTVFAYVFAAGVALFCIDFFRHRKVGKPAPRDPWGAATMEWLYPPVPPGYNFRVIPAVTSREPLWDQPELHAPERLQGALFMPYDGRRETIGCHPATGAPIQILRLPHPTWVPLICAALTALVFVAGLVKMYAFAGVAGAAAVLSFVWWGWEASDSGVRRDTGAGYALPVNVVSASSHTHVGVISTLLISLALYGSLVFGALYLWNVRPDFAEALLRVEPGLATGAVLAGGVTMLAAWLAWLACKAQAAAGAVLMLVVAMVAAVASGAGLLGALLPVDPWASAVGATLWALAVFVSAHLAVSALWALVAALRLLVGAATTAQGLPVLNHGTFAGSVGAMAAVTGLGFLAGGGL